MGVGIKGMQVKPSIRKQTVILWFWYSANDTHAGKVLDSSFPTHSYSFINSPGGLIDPTLHLHGWTGLSESHL